jgi:uncharacterized membrane protein
MKEWLIAATEATVIVIDAIVLLAVIWATIEAAAKMLPLALKPSPAVARAVWQRYARWLVGALTFQLAADILETAVTTEWEAIARLAAVATVRTGLNYFLESDLREAEAPRESGERA